MSADRLFRGHLRVEVRRRHERREAPRVRSARLRTRHSVGRAPTPVRHPPEGAHALVVGASGIPGSALIEQLAAFNTVRGDVVRWRRLWLRLAAHLGVEPQGPDDVPQPLEQQMADAPGVWAELVAAHGLVEPDLTRVASWWHTDADLGREMEVIADMSRSRLLGWTGDVSTERALLALVDRYRTDRLGP